MLTKEMTDTLAFGFLVSAFHYTLFKPHWQILQTNRRMYHLCNIMCRGSPHTVWKFTATYPRKSKSMVEYLAWMSAQKPQKKWEALQKINSKSDKRNMRSVGASFEETECIRVYWLIPSHQRKLVDLYIKRLQLSQTDVFCFLGEELVCLQVQFEPVHL